MTTPVAQALLDEIEAKRGYVLDMHRVLAEHDPDFLRGYETLIDAAYARDGALDRRTKEFVYVAALVALSAPRPQVVAHMEAALEAGATPEELLQVVEQLMPPRRGAAVHRGARGVGPSVSKGERVSEPRTDKRHSRGFTGLGGC
jgi:4-carboxymuconolactone decarboxylase